MGQSEQPIIIVITIKYVEFIKNTTLIGCLRYTGIMGNWKLWSRANKIFCFNFCLLFFPPKSIIMLFSSLITRERSWIIFRWFRMSLSYKVIIINTYFQCKITIENWDKCMVTTEDIQVFKDFWLSIWLLGKCR